MSKKPFVQEYIENRFEEAEEYEAEIARLKAELENWRKRGASVVANVAGLVKEVDRLKAELEAATGREAALKAEAIKFCTTPEGGWFAAWQSADRDRQSLKAERDAYKLEAEIYAESLDNVRAALGLESTHYLIIHDQVTEALDCLKAEVARWKSAVEGLTPGGSEYVDDPERCADHIRQRCAWPKKMITLKAENERLAADKARLVGALEFYAEANNYILTKFLDAIIKDGGLRARQALKEVQHD